ncbi:N-acetylmuramoyl-L-alanine amidase [Seonamhaeicola sp. S2-3]|uniref:N-acetylmuramoyl-L-alanine amidase family protein n=1 Tax=Seonamhaeicola sp. S2-3 TaxID=1936081 RepID=UPI000972A52C|nr:N-acetylmuramoyl-L-alanine amidase [Seonamhaeicola sp. S2-3]APY12592.1 N-acetylmuramoyl-L-alanine amidase [Seonamhaeicola sp. S2-3]
MQTYRLSLFVLIISVLTFSLDTNVYAQSNSNKFVVVLDAGHGGKDPGNMGSGFKEKDIALKIVLETGRQLERNPNIKVVYTRKKDVFIDLDVRGAIANKANADLFVSVHCNAHNSQAHGTETFVLGTHRNKTNFEVAKKENSVIFQESNYEQKYDGFNPNSPESFLAISIAQEEYLDQSIKLARIIQDKFTNSLKRKNRGVKQAGFIVLHQTVMPSVLIEVGFLTYKREGVYLNSSKGQKEISTAITKAILDYKNSIATIGDFSDNKEFDEIPKESNGIEFKIQIAASSKALETKPYNFKGLNEITRLKEGSLYKYYYGSTTNYETTKQLEEEARSKGYSSSFVVAFKNGKKIPLTEALKTIAN